MEHQYNELLVLSKTVSNFYENVYAPVLQTLPWFDEGDGLKIASEKVLGNIAFPAYGMSTYKNKNDEASLNYLRARYDELKSIYEKMQSDLRPILSDLPPHDQNWQQLQKMIPIWQKISSSDLLPHSTHKAVHESFVSLSSNTGGFGAVLTSLPNDDFGAEAALAKVMAAKIRSLHENGESDSSIALKFGSDGFWLDRAFLHRIRIQ